MLTLEQINQIRAKSGLPPKATSSQQNYVGKYDYLKPKPGFIDTVKESAINRIGDAKEALSGDVNPVSAGLQFWGAGAGLVGDVIGAGIQKVAPGVTEKIGEVAGKVMETQPAQNILSSYQDFKMKHPEAAKDLEATTNILSLLPTGKVLQVGSRSAKVGAELAEQGIRNTAPRVISSAKSSFTNIANKASDAITPLDPGVNTVLSKPTTRLAQLTKYERAAKEALLDYSKPTPLELAGQSAEKALTALQSKLNGYAEAKKAITESLSTFNTGKIVNNAKSKMRQLLKERAGLSFTESGKFKNATNRLNAVSDPTDLKLIKNIDWKLSQVAKNPTFQRVDDAIDYFQDLLYKRNGLTAIPINKKVEGIIKQTIGELNNELKKIGGSKYSGLNSVYSKTKHNFDLLNKALGIDGNKGASLMKQLFSPSGTAPRKLFSFIKEKTGIDLVDEATLAKFAMENIGDVRQASLLEQVLKGSVPTSGKSLIELAAEKTINKLQNPLSKARRILESKKTAK